MSLNNLKTLPIIAVAVSTTDNSKETFPDWLQKAIDITGKPEFIGGLSIASLIAYFLNSGTTKVYNLQKHNNEEKTQTKYYSSTFSYFDVGILCGTIGASTLAKFSDTFCEKYYQLTLVGISVFDFIFDVTNLSNIGTKEKIHEVDANGEIGGLKYIVDYQI